MIWNIIVGLVIALAVYLVLKLTGWFAGTPCTCDTRLNGKVAVVTGANTGIGKETALDLAKRGAKVIIGCRDMKKAERACQDIYVETGVNVEAIPLDLADTGSVESFAKKIVENEDKLDILVNNAGLMMPLHKETKQGFELHMGVNHLGHFLLTHRLYQLLAKSGKSSDPSRIINVSSDGHKFCFLKGLDVDAPDFGKARWAFRGPFAFHRLYGQSKLSQIYHAKQLTKMAAARKEPVLSVSLHPGAVATEVTRYHSLGFAKTLVSFIDNMLNYCGKTPTEGAQTTIHCCVADHTKLQGGSYYVDCSPVNLQPWLVDERKEEKLMDVSKKLLGLS